MPRLKFDFKRLLASFIVSITCVVVLHLNLFTTSLWVCLVLFFYDIFVVDDQDTE